MITLADAVGLVKVTEEDRTGYTRTKFKHWNSGDDSSDGCNTRNEVLLAEAVVAPTVEAGCKLTGGSWTSYYDGQEVSSSRLPGHRPHGPAGRGLGQRGLRLVGGAP